MYGRTKESEVIMGSNPEISVYSLAQDYSWLDKLG